MIIVCHYWLAGKDTYTDSGVLFEFLTLITGTLKLCLLLDACSWEPVKKALCWHANCPYPFSIIWIRLHHNNTCQQNVNQQKFGLYHRCIQAAQYTLEVTLQQPSLQFHHHQICTSHPINCGHCQSKHLFCPKCVQLQKLHCTYNCVSHKCTVTPSL